MVERSRHDDRESVPSRGLGRRSLLGHLGERVRTVRSEGRILGQRQILGPGCAVTIGRATHQDGRSDADLAKSLEERNGATDVDAKRLRGIGSGVGREGHPGEVDDSVRRPAGIIQPAPQAGAVGDVQDVRARCCYDLMAVAKQLRLQPPADEAVRAGDEDPHRMSGVA